MDEPVHFDDSQEDIKTETIDINQSLKVEETEEGSHSRQEEAEQCGVKIEDVKEEKIEDVKEEFTENLHSPERPSSPLSWTGGEPNTSQEYWEPIEEVFIPEHEDAESSDSPDSEETKSNMKAFLLRVEKRRKQNREAQARYRARPWNQQKLAERIKNRKPPTTKRLDESLEEAHLRRMKAARRHRSRRIK